MTFTPFPVAVPTLALVAATPPTGFALQNGTPNILTWTAPNDGNMHTVFVTAIIDVSVVEVGGAINCRFPDSLGNSNNPSVIAGAQAVGVHNGSQQSLIGPGQTATLAQNSALTSGAATCWANIWAA